ncbi:hypothetical protein EON67_06750 [archaeon]|nr:MAG: hypothetical protein EON67_06750 [archaeon]
MCSLPYCAPPRRPLLLRISRARRVPPSPPLPPCTRRRLRSVHNGRAAYARLRITVCEPFLCAPLPCSWLSERFPLINQDIADGTLLPSVDALYFDLNGHIHNATHGDGMSKTLSQHDVVMAVMRSIDRAVQLVRCLRAARCCSRAHRSLGCPTCHVAAYLPRHGRAS